MTLKQLKEKLQAAEQRACSARNDYILALTAANAFKKRYYKVRQGDVCVWTRELGIGSQR